MSAGKNYAWDAGRRHTPRVRQVNDGRGGIASQKLPNMPYLMMVDPQGNICPVVLSNGAGNRMENDPYRLEILAAKAGRGWVPMNRCPQNTQHARWLPDDINGRNPCKTAFDGQPIGIDRSGDEHPCACVKELERVRKARNAENESKRDPGKNIAQQQLEATVKQNEMLASALAEKLTLPKAAK